MTLLDELDGLTKTTEARYAILEGKWIAAHRRAQNAVNKLEISPICPLDGLMDFLTRAADSWFENAVQSLWADFDRLSKEIALKYDSF